MEPGMPRPSIVQVTVVLLIALLGTVAIAAVQRIRAGRADAATTPAAAQPTAAEQAASAAAPLEASITVPDAPQAAKPAPKPKPKPTFAVARVKPGHTLALRSKPRGRVLASVGATTEF